MARTQRASNPLPSQEANAVDAFVDALWLEDGLSANTLAAYRRDLTLFAQWLHTTQPDIHPLLQLTDGPLADWERP